MSLFQTNISLNHSCKCVRVFGQGQDVIMNMWKRSAASGSLTAALNITELNGNGRLQLAHTQEKRPSLWAHTRLLWYGLPLMFKKKNLKQFKHFREFWQPGMHWITYKDKALTFLFCELVKQTGLSYTHVPCAERQRETQVSWEHGRTIRTLCMM